MRLWGVFFLWLWAVWCLEISLNVSDVVSTIVVASRTERDIAMLLPIGQTNSMGISLNTMLFDEMGYNESTLPYVRQLLSGGIQLWMLDLYYNPATEIWQLCPAPFPQNSSSDASATRQVLWNSRQYHCQPLFTFDAVLQEFRAYLLRTNTNIAVSLVQLMVNLHEIKFAESKNRTQAAVDLAHYATFTGYGNKTLNDSLGSVDNFLFTPQSLLAYQSSGASLTSVFYNRSSLALPLLNTFLLTDYKRMFANVVHNGVPSALLGPNDKSTVFFDHDFSDIARTSDPSTLDACSRRSQSDYDHVALTTNFRTVFDTPDNPFNPATFRRYVECGYSPVFNASSYVIGNGSVSDSLSDILTYYFPRLYWLWAPGQPRDRDDARNSTSFDRHGLLENDSVRASEEATTADGAQKCVTLQEAGFVLSGCYQSHRYACQNKKSPNDWRLSLDSQNYFSDDNDVCPEGYFFSVPKLSIEAAALRDVVEDSKDGYPVWIDLNDITVSNCFVTGGPYAQCPYQRTVSGRKLVGLIAPSFVVALVILLLIFFEKFFRVNPVQTNRKRHWRRAINEYNKTHGYEGVPS